MALTHIQAMWKRARPSRFLFFFLTMDGALQDKARRTTVLLFPDKTTMVYYCDCISASVGPIGTKHSREANYVCARILGPLVLPAQVIKQMAAIEKSQTRLPAGGSISSPGTPSERQVKIHPLPLGPRSFGGHLHPGLGLVALRDGLRRETADDLVLLLNQGTTRAKIGDETIIGSAALEIEAFTYFGSFHHNVAIGWKQLARRVIRRRRGRGTHIQPQPVRYWMPHINMQSVLKASYDCMEGSRMRSEVWPTTVIRHTHKLVKRL